MAFNPDTVDYAAEYQWLLAQAVHRHFHYPTHSRNEHLPFFDLRIINGQCVTTMVARNIRIWVYETEKLQIHQLRSFSDMIEGWPPDINSIINPKKRVDHMAITRDMIRQGG